MKRYFLISLVVGYFSCNTFNGNIEKRDVGCDSTLANSKKVYLVNESKSHKYRFTVKTTKIINESGKEYSTEFIALEPGDEVFLGCDSKIELFPVPKKKIPVHIDSLLNLGNTASIFYTYDVSILKYNFDWHFAFNNQSLSLADIKEGALASDMPINEYVKKAKILIEIPENSILYDDSLKKYPKGTLWLKVDDSSESQKRIFCRYKFEITGQIEIKDTNFKKK